MSRSLSGSLRLPLIALFSLAVVACSDSSDSDRPGPVDPPVEPPEPELTYRADIVWTEYGIPHINAEDWGGLGYGAGYAFAEQNFCTYMRDVVRANGQSAQYLGEDGNLEFDFVMKLYNTDEAIERVKAQMSERGLALFAGYAAGISRYLDETGVDNLAEGEEGCRGAAWVRPVTLEDALKSGHKTILRASADPFHRELVAAVPPADSVAALAPVSAPLREQALAQIAATSPEQLLAGFGFPATEVLGSNAYGIGRDAAGIDSGVLYGNPHFPWQGINRFFMAHYTIPGEYDVMGAGLFGIPLANIGFNKDTAWSHTVSTARRFTLHELEINPDNPLQYYFGDELVDLEPVTVSAVDGEGQTVEHTFYQSQFGTIADLGNQLAAFGGWPTFNGTIFAFNDVNQENLRGLENWINFGQAESLDDILEATRTIGIPWVNTIAADRSGEGFYGDISTVPNASQQLIDSCVRGPIATPILAVAGIVTLDGSDPDCQLGNDEGAPENVLGFDKLPKLRTTDYAANANDSYWLPNPRNLLTGFSRAIGPEEYPQTIRTRLTFVQAEQRLAGEDDVDGDGLGNQQVRDILTSARNHAAELVNDDVVAICEAVGDWSPYGASDATMAQACEVLAAWDKRHQIDSVGGHIFYELWQRIGSQGNLWAVPFDATDPVNTPNTLNTGNEALVETVRQGLADAVALFEDNGIALDAPWGEVQFVEKNGERIPIPGGSGSMLFSVISAGFVEGEGYSNVRAGNSYIQAVSWDESDCPDANAVLTYSQSTDPASPHYADATRLYSESGWIDMPFCEIDRDAQEIRRATIEE
ncbi:penicillin acylase family protein [Seongchinamella sediminis]|uniref:penicillin acylase family protein n=1 Tax=Seongchinamella sediminis TaxID=2283635 RepID=UPI0013C2FB10|nr:penicillin acylase family protein [Seongchinamella sediminis]